ncbi:exonuclease V-like [Amblyomma americanum]
MDDSGAANAWDDEEGDDLIAKLHFDGLTDSRPPLQKYRNGRIYVSDLSSQVYCEQKLLYTLIGVPRLKEMGFDVEEAERPQVARGSHIHLARQLEVQDVVAVDTKTREDNIAVLFVNLLHAVRSLLSGAPIVREVPVFGRVLDGDIFVNGVVDEIRCDGETLQIDIVELKTIAGTRLPNASVRRPHRLQVMLYRHLLASLILGKVDVKDIEKGFHVNLDVQLSSPVLELLPSKERHMNSLGLLVPFVLTAIQALPVPSQLTVEYFSQKTNATLCFQGVEYDESWLVDTLQQLFPFWTGSWLCSTWLFCSREGLDYRRRPDNAELLEYRGLRCFKDHRATRHLSLRERSTAVHGPRLNIDSRCDINVTLL